MRKILLFLLAIICLSACVGKTRQTETLVLYTSMKDSLIAGLAEDFEDKHPNIKVETRIDGAGSLMARIESERKTGAILADIIWTSEIPDFYYMKDEGLLIQYTPAGADKLLNPLEDTGGYFQPARLGTMGIAYNTNLVDTPPESWLDLLGSTYANSFAIADPETSGTALMGVVMLTEAFGGGFFRALGEQGAFIAQGSSQVVEAVARGEIAACLAVDYITFDKINSGAPIALVYPQEMLVIPSPVAIFRDGSNIEAAKKFVDYLITSEAQRIIAGIGTLPVLDSVSVSEEFNIPSVAEAMSRAIEINEADMTAWKDNVVSLLLDAMWGRLTLAGADRLPDGFVYITDMIPDTILEIRYYSTYNFIGARIDDYLYPVAIMTQEAADALKLANDELRSQGYAIKVFDAYRPQGAVDHFVRWAADIDDVLTKEYFYPGIAKERIIPDGYVAERSGHSRGSTVDLTLIDMKTGRELDMGTPFDFFGPQSHHGSDLITREQADNRLILKNAMENAGFRLYDEEWWHYTLNDEPYPDIYFEFPVK